MVEEVDEAELWLDVIDERHLGAATARKHLVDESRQLRAIVTTALATARRNQHPNS